MWEIASTIVTFGEKIAESHDAAPSFRARSMDHATSTRSSFDWSDHMYFKKR